MNEIFMCCKPVIIKTKIKKKKKDYSIEKYKEKSKKI